jgi:hypothetical protein
MQSIIFLTWFLLLLIIPLALLVVSYISYVNGIKISEIIAKLFLSLLVYIPITFITFWFMFVMVFAGAHSNPVGESLTAGGKVFYSAMVLIYGLTGWLLCSLVSGKLIKPWSVFILNTGKSQSIFSDVKNLDV